MIPTIRRMSKLMGLVLGCSVMVATPSYADTISWADWISADGVSAAGTFDNGVTVAFTGVLAPPAQIGAVTDVNYWNVNSSIYTSSPQVDNAPTLSDIIRLTGGTDDIQKLTFSVPVLNPVMAILSLGQGNVPVEYQFNTPFTILNQGTGYWGGTNTDLTVNGNILSGTEGHGIIQFTAVDPISSISWTVPHAEDWHGFTIGVSVPEPASLILLGAGLAGIGIWRRKATKIG